MKTIALGEPLIHLSSVDSTNDYALKLLHEDKGPEGTVILADYQLHGKGQRGNQWVSDKKTNLLFSIILKPAFLPVEKQFYLSMGISNGIVDFVSSITGNSLIKWPNDVLLYRKKVAGILIENTIMGNMLNSSVIGIGLNVNQRVFPYELPDSTSLSLISGKEYSLPEMLTSLLSTLSVWINHLYEGRLDLIRTNYLNHLWGLNEWSNFTDDSGRFEGRITDVADSGELIIMHRSGDLRQYGFKEIRFDV